MVVIAAPAAVVIALLMLAFMIAWYYWGNTITHTLSVNIPVIGNVIGNAISDGLEVTYAALVYWFDGPLHSAANFIQAPVTAMESLYGALNSMGAQTYNSLWRVINVHGPAWVAAAVGGAQQFTQQVYNQLSAGLSSLTAHVDNVANAAASFTQQVFNGLESQIQSAEATAQTFTTQVYNQAIGYTQQVDAALTGAITQAEATAAQYTLDAYHAATGYAASLAVQGAQDLANAETALESYAQTTATAAVGVLSSDIDQAITGAVSTIWTDVDGAVTDVIGVIGADDPDILSAIKSLDWSIPRDIAGVAALAGVSALTLTRYLRDCGIPNCKNLSTLGKDLQALLGLVGDASFLAFIIELAEHPSNAVSIVDDAFGTVINDTVGAARSMLGV